MTVDSIGDWGGDSQGKPDSVECKDELPGKYDIRAYLVGLQEYSTHRYRMDSDRYNFVYACINSFWDDSDRSDGVDQKTRKQWFASERDF